MADVFESAMILLFGVAWPASIYKSYRSRTAKGKSIYFLVAVELGYVSGVISKLIDPPVNYVIIFYCINTVLVLVDILLYIRNNRLDQAADGSIQMPSA
jgi:hypothetical protein